MSQNVYLFLTNYWRNITPRAYVCLAVHVAEFEVAFSLLGIDNAQVQPVLSVPNQLLLLC